MKKSKWVQHEEFNGLFMERNEKHHPPKKGTKMKFVCDTCKKEKIWIFPDIPDTWKQYDEGSIFCDKCTCPRIEHFFDPHRTGAAQFY